MLNDNTGLKNPNAFNGAQYMQQGQPPSASLLDDDIKNKTMERNSLIAALESKKRDPNITAEERQQIDNVLERVSQTSGISVASQQKSAQENMQQNVTQLNQNNANTAGKTTDLSIEEKRKRMQQEAERLQQQYTQSVASKTQQMNAMKRDLNKLLEGNTSPPLTPEGAAKQMRDRQKYEIINDAKLAQQASLSAFEAQQDILRRKAAYAKDEGLDASRAPVSSQLQYSSPAQAQTKSAEAPPPLSQLPTWPMQMAAASTQTPKPKNDALVDDIAKANFLAKTIEEDAKTLEVTNQVNCILEGNAQRIKVKDAAGLYTFISSFHAISSTIDPKENVTVNGQTYNMETLYAIDPKTNMSVWSGLPLKTKEGILEQYKILSEKARKRSALYSGLFKVASAALGITSIVLMFVPGGQIAGAALMGATLAVHLAKAAFTAIKVKKAADAQKNSSAFQTMQREGAAQSAALSKSRASLKEVLAEANGTITDERRAEIEAGLEKSNEAIKAQGKYDEKTASLESDGMLSGLKKMFSGSKPPSPEPTEEKTEMKLKFGPKMKERTESEQKDILDLIEKTRNDAGVSQMSELSKEDKRKLSDGIKSLSKQHNEVRKAEGRELLETQETSQDQGKSQSGDQTQGNFTDKEKKRGFEVTQQTEYVRQ